MPQIINTNIASLNAQRNLNNSQRAGDTALQRLSSGLRINSAKDDAAGLAISTRFDSQIRGTSVAIRNSGDAISLTQTAEGALGSIATNLQRIRELALQSANDTNSSVDRGALQEEVNQLIDEIENISQNTNFNGKKLLDGSFQNSQFQTGANVGETITVTVSKLDTETLGSAQSAGVSTAASNTTDRTSSMVQGDLVINGIAVGAADAAADGASTASQEFSAIAVASAINKVANLSGVDAEVNANVVGGSDVTSTGVATAGTVTINGTAINVGGSNNAATVATDLQSVADQINLFSGQTGVTAKVDASNLEAGVQLTAADGRNVVVSGGSAFGVGAAKTYTGSVTLVSRNGGDITVSSNTGNSLENVGIESGVYTGGKSIATSDKLTGTALTSGDLVINGVQIGATYNSYDTASTGSKSGSAIAVAAAINLVSDQTGVKAYANAAQVLGTVTANTGGTLNINGVSISVANGTTGTTSEQVGLAVSAINLKSAQTGVTARAVDDNNYELLSTDGRNISISTAAVGVSAGTNFGSVRLESGGQINISTKNPANIANSGFEVGTYGSAETGQSIGDIDITTVEGANLAITAVDNALQTITSKQAELGAVQNRFQNTIANLESQYENLSAANSRIKDADFAAETAALSRASVLQQAGISVLAQANARPQQVLSLLQ